VETNGRRSRSEFEYALLDTGVFNEDRYFDVFVEYAKAAPEDSVSSSRFPLACAALPFTRKGHHRVGFKLHSLIGF